MGRIKIAQLKVAIVLALKFKGRCLVVARSSGLTGNVEQQHIYEQHRFLKMFFN